MPATPAEVGQVYDLLLQTRDGMTLPCRNKDGKIVNVSQVAYMTSIDRTAQGQHEETELQHKDQLVQFASSNLIDREFTQWPQVTQGDWSGGMLQRVFSGANADPTRYWDGTAILYPLADYLPSQPLIPAPYTDSPNLAPPFTANGVGAQIGSVLNAGTAIAFIEQGVGAPRNNTLVFLVPSPSGPPSRTAFTNPTGLAAGVGVNDMFFAFDQLWIVTSTQILFADPTGSTTVFDTLPAGASSQYMGSSAGWAGAKPYLAIAYTDSNASPHVRLYDLSASNTASQIELPLPTGGTSGTPEMGLLTTILQTLFVGDTLYISIRSGNDANCMTYSISGQVFSHVAYFSGVANAYMCTSMGGIFIATTGPDIALYLLQGTTLQQIGTILPSLGQLQPLNQLTGTGLIQNIGFPVDVMIPCSFESYAVLPVIFNFGHGTSTFFSIYVYDVLRGRLFKAGTVGPFDPTVAFAIGGAKCSIFPSEAAFLGRAPINIAWDLVIGTNGKGSGTVDIYNFQEMWIGPSTLSGQPIQTGCQFIGSTIDFTSAEPKLYRQLVARWLNPLPNDANTSVQIDAWLDQDPNNLAVTPDFSVILNGNGHQVFSAKGQQPVIIQQPLGATRLPLLINQIAVKLIYRVTVTGAYSLDTSFNIIPAPKLISVAVQAATGWVQNLKLDLAPRVETNSKNAFCWEKQSTPGQPAVDAVVAYNFLRQLWRLKGGEVVATFPNGDSGDWLIQDIAFDSPKPFATSFRADLPSQYQTVATVKIREDI